MKMGLICLCKDVVIFKQKINKIILYYNLSTLPFDKVRFVSEMKIKASFILHFTQLAVPLHKHIIM